jgi:hypothetical protein
VLTSSPPQPSSATDVAPQDTRDPSAASPLPHTKPRAHTLTQKTYVANQNNICPKPAQEDIADSSVSSMPEPYVLIVQVIQRSIVLKQIQLSLNCPKNPTWWHLQMFLTHLLLSFIHHPLPELISFSSNLSRNSL